MRKLSITVGALMLQGIRVLDLSRLLPGPACTWFLAGMGAEVDRVEPVQGGDYSRLFPPFFNGTGAIFASVSRGKRSMTLDMRNPRAGEIIGRLAKHYDVIVEGFKPGVLEKIGLDPQALADGDPPVIIARLSGFGQTGPWSDRPGHDLNYLGLAGALAGMGRNENGPVTPVFQLADMGGGAIAAMGIAGALVERARTGKGRVLDVSLSESAMAFMAPHVTGWTIEGRAPEPGGEMLSGSWPVYGSYECRDGKWITLGALEPKFQAVLAERAGSLERDNLIEFFKGNDRDHWVEDLAGACVGPVLEPHELAQHPQHAARGAVLEESGCSWVRPPFSTKERQLPVPKHGEHTDVILAEAGFSTEEITRYRETRAIK